MAGGVQVEATPLAVWVGEKLPRPAGLVVQLTVVSWACVTVAVTVAVCAPPTVTLVALRVIALMATVCGVAVADAVTELPAALVAVR